MAFWSFLIIFQASGFLPGITEKVYPKGQEIKLFAGTLSSARTQLPLDYYYLGFCKSDEKAMEFDNIGQALTGDVLEMTPYSIKMRGTKKCTKLCDQELGLDQINSFKWAIVNEYRAQWYLDSLPVGLRISDLSQEKNFAIYQDGFPIGYYTDDRFFIYNHHHIIIKISKSKENIVGFLVQPFSLSNQDEIKCESADFSDFIELSKKFKEIPLKTSQEGELLETQVYISHFMPQQLEPEVSFTYSVAFEQSELTWASRWDVYLYSAGGKVHWISITNSFIMVLILTFIVGNIFKRAVSRDITAYNESSDLDLESDSGWKQLKGEVFRNPSYSSLFSILIGSGIQIITMSFFTLAFACIGFLSPSHRGYLVTIILLLYSMTGFVSGLVSGRLYKMFNGLHWKKNALGTSMLIPGTFFSIFVLINIIISQENTTLDVSFYSLFELLLIWIGVTLPLNFFGSAIGYKKAAIVNPVSVSRIPKPLPLKFPLKLYLLIVLCSSLPFASSFVELSYIMNSVWGHLTFYYLFGFLFLCFIILLVVSGEISVLVVYITLCQEEYRWWWISFIAPAMSGGYMFLYAVYYYMFQMDLSDGKGTLMYFGYMVIGCVVFALITGSIGFVSSFVFVRKIYSLIKLE